MKHHTKQIEEDTFENDEEIEVVHEKRSRKSDQEQSMRLSKFQIIATCVGFFLLVGLFLYGVVAFVQGKEFSLPDLSFIQEKFVALTTKEETAVPLATTEPSLGTEEVPAETEEPSSSPKATESPTPTPTIKTITKLAGQDGTVSDTGAVATQSTIDVGRTPEVIYRGFVGFDIAEIPADAKITKATLRLYQSIVSANPYGTLGALQVDHLDYGSTLTAESYTGGNVFSASFGTIGSAETLGWKSLDVTEQVIQDRASHTSSQFRLHFSNETKGGSAPGDTVSFTSSTGGNEQPQLIVVYN